MASFFPGNGRHAACVIFELVLANGVLSRIPLPGRFCVDAEVMMIRNEYLGYEVSWLNCSRDREGLRRRLRHSCIHCFGRFMAMVFFGQKKPHFLGGCPAWPDG